MHLREDERIGARVLHGDLFEARRVGPADEVIGKVKQIHRNARLEERIADLRQDLVELRPGEIERLEVLETPRAQDTPLQGLPPAGEVREKALRVSPRERRQRLLSQGSHGCITP